jgi:hypothetical protein
MRATRVLRFDRSACIVVPESIGLHEDNPTRSIGVEPLAFLPIDNVNMTYFGHMSSLRCIETRAIDASSFFRWLHSCDFTCDFVRIGSTRDNSNLTNHEIQ